jgi:O-antigen/teichoic acid export membrane protein
MGCTDVHGAAASPAPDAQAFRSQMGHISRHSSVFFAGTIISAAASYLFKIYLARVLGAEGLGLYTLGMTMVGFLSIFSTLGLPKAAVRFVPTYRVRGEVKSLHRFLARSVLILIAVNFLFATLLLAAGPWVAADFYHAPALESYLGIFAVLLGLTGLTTFMGEVLAGYKNIARRTVIVSLIGNPAMMLTTVVLLTAGLGLRGYIFAQVVSNMLMLFLLARAIRELTPDFGGILRDLSPPLPAEIVSFSGGVLALNLMSFFMGNADRVLIGTFLDARHVGIYAIAAGIVIAVPSILKAVNQVFSPMIADLFASKQLDLLNRIYQTLTKWILGLTLPLIVVLIVFAVPVMSIFGREFEAGWPVLSIGAAGQLVNCGVGSAGTILLMSGNQSRLLRIQIPIAAATVALAALFIFRWGMVGAAIAAAIANVVTNLCYLLEVRRTLKLFPYNRSYVKLILPVAGTITVALAARVLLSSLRPQWLIAAIAMGIAYTTFVSIALAFGLDPDDRLVLGAVKAKLLAIFPKPRMVAR